MKAVEQYFPVLLFVMLYKVVFTFESVDGILKLLWNGKFLWCWVFFQLLVTFSELCLA